jgi:predicted metal-binding membrane protein
MHRIQKIILISIISITAISWILSKDQPDTMTAMMNYNPVAISLFTISWTIGMAAMMFPAITPMVLLYSRLIKNSSSNSSTSNSGNTDGEGINSPQSSVFVEPDDDKAAKRENRLLSLITSSILSTFRSSVNILFFVCSYLLVWAITGIVLLLAWSILVNYFFVHFEAGEQQHQVQLVYGIVLIISGVYQFSSLKTKCIGYCESPFSFFMRRWRSGTIGAVKMGVYHGLYCLGCCWPYFLLMIALGWMNLIWMALFAGIIFGEKIWSKGVWIARSAGIGFAIVGIMTICGVLTIIPTGMNNNNPTNGDDNMHMGGMNMDVNKNLNAANKPTSTKMMPRMNDM